MKIVKKQKVLTELEKKFAQLYVENMFSNETRTNTDIAIEAGYAKDSAYQRAYENITYKIKPHVVNYIENLKEDFRVRNQITPEKHMARLNEIHKMAKDKGQLHTAMNAEVYRGKAAGYYVEKQLIKKEETEEDTEKALKEIIEPYDLNKQYMKMEQDLFHEKWKVRFLTRRLREIAPHEALSEEELDEQIKGKQH